MPKNTSKKWSFEIKTLVDNSTVNLLRVYDNTFIDTGSLNILNSYYLNETCHCDFCGQKIKYVSVLKFSKNTDISYFQIGKECMSYLFQYDMKIAGLQQAKCQVEIAVKKLMEKSTERTRAEKYKNELGKYITWLDSLDENFIKRNNFLRFINNRLRTGDGVVTMTMVNSLEEMIKKYTPQNTHNLNKKTDYILDKIDNLLEDIQLVLISAATYNFVRSVRSFVVKNGNASKRQLETLNKIANTIKILKKKHSEDLLKAFSMHTSLRK